MAADNQAIWQRGRVLDARPVATAIQQLVLETESPRAAAPGSHIDVVIDGISPPSTRSYSVVTSDRVGRQLTISVNLANNSRGGSQYMHALRPDAELTITQPLQNFPLRTGAPRYVLLAGGIGITALVSMAHVLHGLPSEYQLVYVGRNRARMAYLEQLTDLHGENLRVHVTEESTGLDTTALIDEIADAGRTELYMCGPIRLMDAVRRRWLERNLPMTDLRYETFGNTGWFDAEEFVVEVPRLGVVTTVGNGQSLLEALEAAGVGVIADCCKGECGLCQVRVLNIEGTIDHRDVFLSDAQKIASTKMCACVSRAVRSRLAPASTTAPTAHAAGRAILTIDVP